MLRHLGSIFALGSMLLAGAAGRAFWQRSSFPVGGEQPKPTCGMTPHDGRHDFDFLLGRWRVHNRRLLHPLTGSKEWVEFDGASVAHRMWDGRANVDEYEGDSPSGPIEGLTVRTYNAETHEWSEYWANSSNGAFSLPAAVGHFANGRGELFDHETIDSRPVLVRFLWLDESANRCRWEQAFSNDEGKTWETNWTMDFTRVESTPL